MNQFNLVACQYCQKMWAEPVMPSISFIPKSVSYIRSSFVGEPIPFEWSTCKSCEESLEAQRLEHERLAAEQKQVIETAKKIIADDKMAEAVEQGVKDVVEGRVETLEDGQDLKDLL